MFIGTWNVGGKPPEVGVDLKDWTQAHNFPPDLYIFGYTLLLLLITVPSPKVALRGSLM